MIKQRLVQQKLQRILANSPYRTQVKITKSLTSPPPPLYPFNLNQERRALTTPAPTLPSARTLSQSQAREVDSGGGGGGGASPSNPTSLTTPLPDLAPARHGNLQLQLWLTPLSRTPLWRLRYQTHSPSPPLNHSLSLPPFTVILVRVGGWWRIREVSSSWGEELRLRPPPPQQGNENLTLIVISKNVIPAGAWLKR